MAKTKISEFSATPSNNTDIDGINIAEGCAPSGINDAIRELMSQLKDWQAGTSNDPYVIGSSGSLTLNQGTANGVLYLNSSKVATSGSALTFDGSKLGIGETTPAQALDIKTSTSTLVRLTGGSGTGQGSGYFIANNARSSTLLALSDDSQINGGASETLMSLYSTKPLAFYANGSEGMRLTSTGLGIGTSSPNGTLQLSRNASSGNWLVLDDTRSGYGDWAFYKVGANDLTIGYDTTAGSAPTQALTISYGGNLGLGVTPSAWGSAWKAFQIGSVASIYTNSDFVRLGNNVYGDSAYTEKYLVSDYATQYVQANGYHAWMTSTTSGTAGNAITFTQAMTLDASGNLLVGTTSQLQSSRFSVLGTGNIGDFRTSSASGYPVVCENTASGSTNMVIFLTGASTTTVGSITYNGSLTLYNTTSDQRLKENIQDAESASSLIDSLQVRKFDWKESGVHQRYGFVAQELVNIVPEAVNQPEDTEEMMAVDYSKLVPMLVKEIQSLRVRVAQLESN